MDRLLGMQTFVRVVEAGSFSAVAREQNATQSAVSKQVAALERQLGVKLLTRTTRALALTDDGQRYFEDARRLVAEVAEAEARLRRGERQLTGWLRVAASVSFGLRVLMPHVRSFLALNPAVKIDLKLDDGFVDLIEQGVDVALRIGNLADSSLVARRVGTAQRILLASPGYLAALPPERPAPRALADLADHACIVYTELATGNLWEFGCADGGTVTVRVEGPLSTNSSEVVRAALLDGLGICYSPTWLVDDLLADGSVCRLLPQWSSPPLPMQLVSPRERSQAAKVRAFGEHVARALGAAAESAVAPHTIPEDRTDPAAAI